MGFKIVISGATESLIAKLLVAKADELPWDVFLCGRDFTAESVASVDSFFSKKTPSVVINLMTEPGDHALVSSLKNLAAVCAQKDIPLIHQSCYWAVSPEDARSEVFESCLADQNAVSDEFARFEVMAAQVHKHIILRSSWIIDGDAAGLFANFIPALTGLPGSDMTVSDHDFGAPVTNAHITDVIVALVKQILTGADNWGLFHLRSADACSEAEFCDHLIRQLNKELELELPFPNVATLDDERRFLSMNANLIGRRITDDFGIQMPTWRRGFGRTLRAWLELHAKECGLAEYLPPKTS